VRSWMNAGLVAVALAGTAVFLQLALADWLDQRIPPFLSLIVVVFAAAAYGGVRAGLPATVLSAVLAATVLTRVPEVENPATSRALRVGTFLFEGLAISGCFEAMHRARRRLVQKKAQLEEEVQRRQAIEQELVKAARRKDEFLATLAHELRNPLAPIRNSLELLNCGGSDPARDEARAVIERQMNQMVRMVDDLLDVARIERNRIELHRQTVRLAEIIQRAVETSEPLIRAKGHDLKIIVPAQAILLDADPVRLTQALSNLLNNAAKYTKPAGTIELTAMQDGAQAIVAVRDNGIGISAEMLPRVFDLFVQADQSFERSEGGLGIGLTLVKRLVEMHGGSVEARSEGLGRGSEFVVRLPVATTPTTHEPQQGQPPSTLAPGRHRQRILLVDDDADTLNTLQQLLTLMGNEVRTAHDGLAGVQAAAAFRPDVVFLDIGMPRLNGFDVCRQIRNQPWGRRVILVAYTGWGQDDNRRCSADAGFDYHLVKPVEATALEEFLADLSTTPP